MKPRILGFAAVLVGMAAIPVARASEFGLSFDDLMAVAHANDLISQAEGGGGGNTLFYSNTIDHSSATRYNPGAASMTVPADASRSAYDDVAIPNAILAGNTAIDISRITVGIRRLANAPATDVKILLTTMTTFPTTPDTEIDLPAQLVCTVHLPANGGFGVTTPVSCGNGTMTIAAGVPVNSTLFPGFGTIAIGVQLSNTHASNGWRVTNGPAANANVFWLHDPNHSAQATDEAAYAFDDGSPPDPPATFWIEVEGRPVPEPAAASLVVMGGTLMLVRRRRR